MAISPDLLTAMKAAATLPPIEFVESWMLRATPYAFRSDLPSYQNFCDELGERLGVDSANVALIGSGRLGFSLNEARLLSLFRPSSDLDMVVVSSDIFDNAWLDLLSRAKEIQLISEDEKRRLKKTRENFFSGYLRPDQLPLNADLARNWFPKISGRFESSVASLHTVKAWLFKSWQHVNSCYSDYLNRIQPNVRKLLIRRGEL